MPVSSHHALSPDRAAQGAARRLGMAAGGAALLLVLAGCGDEPVADTATSDETSTGASARADGDRPVVDRFIEASDLPGSWRDSEPPGPGFKQLVCEVDIEPVEPVDGGAIRFSQGGLGPFLAQHVRIHSDDATPTAVVRDLKAALPGCTSYTTKGNREDSPSVRFDVEPLTVEGLPDNAVAWRQTPDTGSRLTTDLVLVADGEALVALTSYELEDEPDPQVLEQAVAAIQRGE